MSNPDENVDLKDVTDLPTSRETTARQNGFVGAYGSKTWDEIVHDFYETDPSLSTANEEIVKAELEHVMQLTGQPEAAMDPAVQSSKLNRIA